MDIQEINKSINQMKTMFGFFTIISIINIVLGGYYMSNSSASSLLACTLLYSLFGVFIFGRAYRGLGRRDKKGYSAAKDASKLFVLGLPVLTYFGISYLRKLEKSEFKQAFGVLD